jgi:nitrogen regulatory protein PII
VATVGKRGHSAVYRDREYEVSLLTKMKIEAVVPDEMVEDVIAAIMSAARTGEIGGAGSS